MSDRTDTPRWEDDVPELVLSTDQPPGADGLEEMRENVLDGLPAAGHPPPTADEPVAAVEPVADVEPVAAVEPVADVEPGSEAASDQPADSPAALLDDPPAALLDDPPAALLDDPPAALADHVSATMEHEPGDLSVPPGYAVLEGEARGEHRAVGVVVARFNGDVTTRLLESALGELDACGVAIGAITVMPVPGAFELPLAAMALAKTRRFACIIALGCVIRGDTPHFDYVSAEAASGLQLAGIETGVPVSFGVLTLDRADQADSRVGKGAEAVRTALEMADLFANLRAAATR